MSFFNINGWNVPIVNGGMSETSTAFGNTGRSFTNRALINRRMLPRTWTGSMLFQSPTVADTVEGLVSGRGHHFSFDRDVWSDSGAGPTSGTIANITSVQSGDSRFGTGRAEMTADVSFDIGIPPNKYTVMLWVFEGSDWVHHAEVNDATTNVLYTNGEAGFGPTLVASAVNGVITVDSSVGAAIDDLVILPFVVDESFIEQVYRWQTVNDMVMYCPFDYPLDFVDRIGGNQGTASSALVTDVASGCQVKKSGEGSLFFATSQTVSYAGADVPQLSNETEQTVCFWIRPEALGGSQDVVNQIGAPVFPSWSFSFSGSQMVVNRGVSISASDMSITDPTSSVDGEWVHFALVYTVNVPTSVAIRLYRGGVLVGTSTFAYAIALVTRDIVFGDAVNGFIGAVDDFRNYHSALSAEQLADVISEGRYGYGPLIPSERAFSKMPRLLVSGDVIGSQTPKQVVGNVTSEPYVQHGGNYSVNDRSMEFTLQEVKKPRERGIPRPDVNFILEPEFIRDQSDEEHLDAIGGYRYIPDGANAPSLVYNNSFGLCYDFVGTDNAFITDDTIGNLSADLGGSTAATVSAWFNADAVARMGLFYLPISTTAGKLWLSTDVGGDITFGGRDTAPPTSAMEITTGGSNYVAGEWYFVAGIIDLLNEEIRVYSNLGSLPQSTVSLLDAADISPAQNYFSSTDGDGSRFNSIGAEGVSNNNEFNGKIKSVALWKRALQEDEIVTVFTKGYNRRIFR